MLLLIFVMYRVANNEQQTYFLIKGIKIYASYVPIFLRFACNKRFCCINNFVAWNIILIETISSISYKYHKLLSCSSVFASRIENQVATERKKRRRDPLLDNYRNDDMNKVIKLTHCRLEGQFALHTPSRDQDLSLKSMASLQLSIKLLPQMVPR